MDYNNPSNIADIITSSGFPHIQVTDTNKNLAYECCFIHEVITKRIPLLDDLREGLMSESSMGTGLLNLASMHPPPSGQIDLVELKRMVQYERGFMRNPDAVVARDFMNTYMEEMSQRGNVHVLIKKSLIFLHL